MDRLFKPSAIRRDPLITLAWIISIMGIVGAIYLLSPALIIEQPSNPSGLFNAVASVVGIVALALAAASGGIVTIYGIVKKRMRWVTTGLLINLSLRVYAFLIGLLVFGLESQWLSSLTMILVVLVVYLALKVPR